MTADTTIIVNVYNGERHVTECLDSILAPLGLWGFKVGIVDEASTDGTDIRLRSNVLSEHPLEPKLLSK